MALSVVPAGAAAGATKKGAKTASKKAKSKKIKAKAVRLKTGKKVKLELPKGARKFKKSCGRIPATLVVGGDHIFYGNWRIATDAEFQAEIDLIDQYLYRAGVRSWSDWEPQDAKETEPRRLFVNVDRVRAAVSESAGVENSLLSLSRQITAGTSTQKEAYDRIARWTCSKLDYVKAPILPAEAISTGKGNCTTYSRLTAILARYAGIECSLATGPTREGAENSGYHSGYHQWLRIRLDGNLYWFDPTWADQPWAGVDRDWFLSKVMWPDHRIG